MNSSTFQSEPKDIAWCPGCGNFSIRKALVAALNGLGLDPLKTVIASGIGQAAKMPQYVNTHFFNGLHGRALPAATAIKACYPDLIVIAEGGDGDMYGEGGNHLLHAIRRNPDITLLVHDNMIYGLTKGQASPTSQEGMVTPVQVFGVTSEPLNPALLAIALDAPFVARVFCGDIDGTTKIIQEAIRHSGFSLVDIFQPCVSFNKINTFAWYREHTVAVDAAHDPSDREAAFRLALQTERFPVGILYRHDRRKPFEAQLPVYSKDKTPLFRRSHSRRAVEQAIREFQ